MPTDPALTTALTAQFTTAELATLHQQLVDQLDDDTPTADPLGRLCDAVYDAAYGLPLDRMKKLFGSTTGGHADPNVYATPATHQPA